MERMTAWSLVLTQFALLGLLAIGPRGRLWPVGPAVSGIGLGLVVLGLIVMAGAAWQIRRALTASPLPNERTQLMERGWFAHVRHPIYLGLLVVGTGLALTRASITAVLLLIGLGLVLQVKARFEEVVLAARFPGYAGYMVRTGRILPRWWGRPASRG
jgi:protein-S-isoprenylcysteine O-methyltransferase Ste14